MRAENDIPPRPLHVFHFHGNTNVSFWNGASNAQSFQGNDPKINPAAPAKAEDDKSLFLTVALAIAKQDIPYAAKWKQLCECFPELKETAKN